MLPSSGPMHKNASKLQLSECKDFPVLCVCVLTDGSSIFGLLGWWALNSGSVFRERGSSAGCWGLEMAKKNKINPCFILLCISEKGVCDNEDSSVENWSALTGTTAVFYHLEGQGILIILEDITCKLRSEPQCFWLFRPLFFNHISTSTFEVNSQIHACLCTHIQTHTYFAESPRSAHS